MENQVPEIAGGRDATDWRNNACEVAARNKTVISVLPSRARPGFEERRAASAAIGEFCAECEEAVSATPVRGGFRIRHADLGDTVMVATAAEVKAFADGARFAVEAIWGGAEVVRRAPAGIGQVFWDVREADPEHAPKGGNLFAAFAGRNEALAFAAGMPFGA